MYYARVYGTYVPYRAQVEIGTTFGFMGVIRSSRTYTSYTENAGPPLG